MKNYTKIIIITLILVANLPFIVLAQEAPFAVSLGYNSTNTLEVMRLQNFLINQGYLHAQASGKYLNLTKNAVMTFQKDQKIKSTGYFGMLTQNVANKISSSSKKNQLPQAIVSTKSSKRNSNVASALLSNQRTITWSTSGYPDGVGVDINLIKKTSDSPATYSFVRTIAKNTKNDGQETWTPQSKETDNDMYIQVVCSSSYEFTQGCNLSGGPIKVN